MIQVVVCSQEERYSDLAISLQLAPWSPKCLLGNRPWAFHVEVNLKIQLNKGGAQAAWKLVGVRHLTCLGGLLSPVIFLPVP